MEPSLNNSFPCYYFTEKYENTEIECDDRNNISAFNMNFLKIFENLNNGQGVNSNNFNICGGLNNLNNTCKEFNFSPQKKKNSIDISYSMEQTFYENSNIINIEEEFSAANPANNEEPYLKIGNEGQNPCIDPIQEVDSFERENNESFLHENNYLLDNFNDTNSFDLTSSNGFPSELMKFDSTMEETELSKLRKNILSLKLSKSNINQNKSDLYINSVINKKKLFSVKYDSQIDKETNLNKTVCLSNNLNLSCTIENPKKRGRKKILFDGIKTEILDKAFLREFKSYLKKSKCILKNTFDEMKIEEKIFWNEFLQNNSPPFFFSENKKKVEYKSFSKSLLKFLFSHQSVKQLYTLFVKEKGKDFINIILNKKIKKIERKMLIFYSFYGKNLHKLYSNDYNLADIQTDEVESYLGTGTLGTSVSSNLNFNNVSDSLTINSSAFAI
jgi:hypothetical protein